MCPGSKTGTASSQQSFTFSLAEFLSLQLCMGRMDGLDVTCARLIPHKKCPRSSVDRATAF